MSHTNIKISNVEIYARLFYNNIKDHCCFCFVLYTFSVFFTNRQTKLDPAQKSKGPPDCELELTRQGKRDALRCVVGALYKAVHTACCNSAEFREKV